MKNSTAIPQAEGLRRKKRSLAAGPSTNRVSLAGAAQTNQVGLPLSPVGGAVFFRLVRP